MTTPAVPSDSEMIGALFHAFAALVPGAVQGDPARWTEDTLERLRHFGAPAASLTVISAWLAARRETAS